MKHKKKVKKHKEKNKPVICPYCGAQAILRPGSYLFNDVSIEQLYVCTKYPVCDSYVAAHPDKRPMGLLADAELRMKRREAHHAFDELWKQGIFTRSVAYKWMSDLFYIKGQEAHIGKLDIDRCERLIRESVKILRNRRECQMGRAV